LFVEFLGLLGQLSIVFYQGLPHFFVRRDFDLFQLIFIVFLKGFELLLVRNAQRCYLFLVFEHEFIFFCLVLLLQLLKFGFVLADEIFMASSHAFEFFGLQVEKKLSVSYILLELLLLAIPLLLHLYDFGIELSFCFSKSRSGLLVLGLRVF
jgi:hypothetical protein